MRGGEIETAKEWQLEAGRVTVGDRTERKRKRERERMREPEREQARERQVGFSFCDPPKCDCVTRNGRNSRFDLASGTRNGPSG